jgi:hypothetical protein
VTKLQTMAKSPALSRLLVVGWWQGDLPDNKHVVLTAWGRTDRCSTISNAVVSTFYAKHLNANLSPEAGLGPISGADQLPPDQLGTPQESSSPAPSASASANASSSP